jgi:hypothetical protein
MSEPLRVTFDGKINLAMVGALVVMIFTVSWWASSVNSRLDALTAALDNGPEVAAKLAALDSRLGQLEKKP